MKLIIATDHRGVEFKQKLIELLKDDYEMVDASPINHPTDDFPDFAYKVSNMLLCEKKPAYGILVCHTGIGMCIAANKVDGIRCALVHNAYTAKKSRSDDDANIIALDSSMDVEFAAECVRIFANTEFDSDPRFSRRVQKVIDIEKGTYNEL